MESRTKKKTPMLTNYANFCPRRYKHRRSPKHLFSYLLNTIHQSTATLKCPSSLKNLRRHSESMLQPNTKSASLQDCASQHVKTAPAVSQDTCRKATYRIGRPYRRTGVVQARAVPLASAETRPPSPPPDAPPFRMGKEKVNYPPCCCTA